LVQNLFLAQNVLSDTFIGGVLSEFLGLFVKPFFFYAADGDGYSVVFSSQFGCKAIMCVRM